jgi:two-component system OmpR family sensor kinase
VLAVTVIALVAFDFAAVGALRRYLVGHTDAQLQSVLGLYRPMTKRLTPGSHRKPPPGTHPPAGYPLVQQVIAGPRFKVPAPILAQFGVGFVSGRRPREFVSGNPALVPRIPPAQLQRVLAALHGPQSVIGLDGNAALRLGAIHEPGGFLYATTSLSDVNSTVDHLELILAIASVAVGLLVAGGIGLVLRRGLRPIERMASQADKITAGDLTERVRPQDPGTEVGRLGAALNGMLTRIEASVSEREASQELTRRFFADASHELRNPLASLRANAELYQQGALRDPHQVDEAMSRITHEAKRMSALVDDMLRLARLDQQPGQQVEAVDVTALVTECAERPGSPTRRGPGTPTSRPAWLPRGTRNCSAGPSTTCSPTSARTPRATPRPPSPPPGPTAASPSR